MENMTYNTEQDKLIIPEYGRNIQNMIEFAKTIEDDEERQAFAEYIVDLMLQMATSSRNNIEFKDKMWLHFFKIAQYDIKVTTPAGEVPKSEESQLAPLRVEYPKNNSAYRHYGQFVRKLVDKAIAMEEGPKKEEFKNIIGSYMKLAYKNWSREHYVNDEVIKKELENMSQGKLVMADDIVLNKIRAANKAPTSNYSKGAGGSSSRRNHKSGRGGRTGGKSGGRSGGRTNYKKKR